FAERLEFLVGAALQVEFLEPAVYFRRDIPTAAQLPIKLEQLADLHLAVETALFRKVTDLSRPIPVKSFAKDADRAPVGIENIHDHAPRGGLARAVRPNESIHRALRNR